MTCTVKLESEDQALLQNGKSKRNGDIEEIIKKNDKVKLVAILLQSIDDVLSPLDNKDYKTALHLAAENDSIDCLKELIERIPPQNLKELIDSPTSDGDTALHIAIDKLNPETISILLMAKAYPNVRNDQGHTPLHYLAYASKTDNPEEKNRIHKCLDLLLESPFIDLDALNNIKVTPLQSAAGQIKSSNKYQLPVLEYCKKLIRNGATVTQDVMNIITEEFVRTIDLLPRNERIARNSSAKMFDYLIKNNPQNIHRIWEDEPNRERQIKKEITDMANKFIGSKRILYHIVNKSNENGVVFFLEKLGADPNVKNLNGEMPIHRALARSNYPITDALIKKMKGRDSVDLTNQSFSLLKKSLENNTEITQENCIKCLERLFQGDVDIDVNQKDSGNQTALHFAATMNNQEAMGILLANGAYLGEHKFIGDHDSGTVLNALMCKTLRSAMDNCISLDNSQILESSHDDLLSPDYCLNLNYKFLMPKYSDVVSSKEITVHNEVKTLYEISQSKEHENTLKHPLIQVFLYAKWQRVMPLYFLNLLLYLFFVILLTAFMYTSKSLRILERMERTGNSTDPFGLQEQLSQYRLQRGVLMAFVLLITFYMMCKEIFQMKTTRWNYCLLLENYLEWFLIIAVFIACFVNLPVDATRHLAAWAMIVAWYEFVLVLGRLPPLAIYITLLRHVSFNFLKVLVLFGFLIIAFSISFNIIFQPSSDLQSGDEFNDFATFWTTLPRAIVMATGEFEYSSYSEEFSNASVIYATSTVLIFMVFLFLIFLVLMNVMTGLAVTDAKEIVEDAILYSLKSRLDLVFLNEQFLLGAPCFRKHLHRIQVLNSEDRKLVVKINKLPKSERITYWQDGGKKVGDSYNCKLDNRTAEVLRTHRLDKIQVDPVANEANSAEEMMRVLREVRQIVENRAANTPGEIRY